MDEKRFSKEELQNKHNRVNGYNWEDYGNNKKRRRKCEPNAFKRKCYMLLEGVRKENMMLFRNMKIMFYAVHIEAHTNYLLEHMEEEVNYYKTYNNVHKCKVRGLGEVLYSNLSEMKLSIYKGENKKVSNKWVLVMNLKQGELEIQTTVKYDKVKNLISNVSELEEVETYEDYIKLGESILNRQQLYEFTLHKALDLLDEATVKLMRYRANVK